MLKISKNRLITRLVGAALLIALPAAAGGPIDPPIVTSSPFLSGSAGVTDQVRAATLLVPYFQVGVNSGFDPDDTLLAITNRSSSSQRIHYEVWDIDGVPADISGNINLAANDTVSLSMRALIDAATMESRLGLEDGSFYRGFVTVDAITANTTLTPVDNAYPFDNDNVLTGWIYYTRLTGGSANGLPMVHLEHVGPDADLLLRDFYNAGVDGREEIDLDARLCASARTALNSGDTVPSCIDSELDTLLEMQFRTFLGGPLNGTTRVVIFTWTNGQEGGPSVLCETRSCASEYPAFLVDEEGNVIDAANLRLDHVVNVIDLTGDDAGSGYLLLRELADVDDDTQVYGFVFNSARPDVADLNWDAIFEATLILKEPLAF